VLDTLKAFAELVAGMQPQPEAMRRAALEGYATATDLADYLVKKGLPFRDAHEAVAHAVRHAVEQGCGLEQLELKTMQGFSGLIEADVFEVLGLEGSLASRNHLGGTAPAQVRIQVAKRRASIGS